MLAMNYLEVYLLFYQISSQLIQINFKQTQFSMGKSEHNPNQNYEDFKQKVNRRRLYFLALKYHKTNGLNCGFVRKAREIQNLKFLLKRLKLKTTLSRKKKEKLKVKKEEGIKQQETYVKKQVEMVEEEIIKVVEEQEGTDPLHQISCEMDLITEQQKFQWPNQLLYHELDIQIPQENKFIPSFVHKELSAQLILWRQYFHTANEITIIENSKIGINQINKVIEHLKKILSYISNCIKKARVGSNRRILIQETKNKFDEVIKPKISELENLKNSKNSKDQKDQKYKYLTNFIFKIQKQTAAIKKKIQNAKNSHCEEFLNQIKKKFSEINKIVEKKCKTYDIFEENENQLINIEKKHRKQLQNYGLQQLWLDYDLQKYEESVKEYIKNRKEQMRQQIFNKQLKDQRFLTINNIRSKTFENHVRYNFALGVMSYVDENDKYLIFKPFEFELSDLEKQSRNSTDKLSQHSEKQIFKVFKQRLGELNKSKKQEHLRFQKAKFIVLDIHTDFKTCFSGENSCYKWLNRQIKKIRLEKKLLTASQQLRVRVSYSTSEGIYAEPKTYQYTQHYLQHVDIDYEFNHYMKFLFNPKNVFISQGILGQKNFYEKAMDYMKDYEGNVGQPAKDKIIQRVQMLFDVNQEQCRRRKLKE